MRIWIAVLTICSFLIGFLVCKVTEWESRGSGEYFYSESLDHPERIIYHSTLHCPAISNGVTIGQFFKDMNMRISNSSFCTKCMDDTLMMKCSEWLDNIQ